MMMMMMQSAGSMVNSGMKRKITSLVKEIFAALTSKKNLINQNQYNSKRV
jgi:hypothetical protein